MVYIRTTNATNRRSVPEIAWGGFYFMSLYTVKMMHIYIYDELPIDNTVVVRV